MVILKHENEALRFALNADGSAQIEDKIGGATGVWRLSRGRKKAPLMSGMSGSAPGVRAVNSSPGASRLQVENDTESIVRCTLLDELHQPLGDFRVRIHLDGIWLRFELLSIDDALPSLVFPPPLEASSLVLPQGVGKWIRKPLGGRAIYRLYSGLNMRWFGGLQADEDKGYLAVWTQGHQNAGVLTTGFLAMSTWLKSLGKWQTPMTVSYRFTSGGYVGLARAYRAWAIENKLHKSLTQKIEELPNVALLLGGRELNCYLGIRWPHRASRKQCNRFPPNSKAAKQFCIVRSALMMSRESRGSARTGLESRRGHGARLDSRRLRRIASRHLAARSRFRND
jgi:hypothetical protein